MRSPNPSETGMRFDFSSPLNMNRVTGKYMRIGYGDGEDKTRLHPALLSCLLDTYQFNDHTLIHKKSMVCYFIWHLNTLSDKNK